MIFVACLSYDGDLWRREHSTSPAAQAALREALGACPAHLRELGWTRFRGVPGPALPLIAVERSPAST